MADGNKQIKFNAITDVSQAIKGFEDLQSKIKDFGESSTKTFKDLTAQANNLVEVLQSVAKASESLGKINLQGSEKTFFRDKFQEKENKTTDQLSKLKEDFKKEAVNLASSFKTEKPKDNLQDKTITDLTKALSNLTSKIEDLDKVVEKNTEATGGGAGGGGRGGGAGGAGGGGPGKGWGGDDYFKDLGKKSLEQHSEFSKMISKMLSDSVLTSFGATKWLDREYGKEARETIAAQQRAYIRRGAEEAIEGDARRYILKSLPFERGLLATTGGAVADYDSGFFGKLRNTKNFDKALWNWTKGLITGDGPTLAEAARASEIGRLEATDLTKYNEILKRLPLVQRQLLSSERNTIERMFGNQTAQQQLLSASSAGYDPDTLKDIDLTLNRFHGANAASNSVQLRFMAKRYGGVSDSLIQTLASGTIDPDLAGTMYSGLLSFYGGLGSRQAAFGRTEAGKYFEDAAASYGFEFRDPSSLMSPYLSTLNALQSRIPNAKEDELTTLQKRLRNEEYAKATREVTQRRDENAQDPTNFQFRSQRVVLEQLGLSSFEAGVLADLDLSKDQTMQIAAKTLQMVNPELRLDQAENQIREKMQGMQKARTEGLKQFAGKEGAERLSKSISEVTKTDFTPEDVVAGLDLGTMRNLTKAQAQAELSKNLYGKKTQWRPPMAPLEEDSDTTLKSQEAGQARELSVTVSALEALKVSLPAVLKKAGEDNNKILKEELSKLLLLTDEGKERMRLEAQEKKAEIEKKKYSNQ
jgi:hypothetical protein